MQINAIFALAAAAVGRCGSNIIPSEDRLPITRAQCLKMKMGAGKLLRPAVVLLAD